MIAFAGQKVDRATRDFFDTVHPEIRGLVSALAAWSDAHGYPRVTITSLVRYLDEHCALYVGRWQGLVARLASGARMTDADRTLALELRELTYDELRERARKRWSWHRCACAVDLRVHHYAPDQLRGVVGWLREHAPPPRWLVLHERSPDHLHIERRDEDWRRRFVERRGPPPNTA